MVKRRFSAVYVPGCVPSGGSSPSSSWKACLLLVLPVRLQYAKTTAPLQLLKGIQKDTYISINKLGIQWFLRANQGRLINLACCLINEL